MTMPVEACLLRIYLGEADRHEGRPLYEWLVRRAMERNLAGATVLRGILGYGRHGHLHSGRTLRLAVDLPVVVEVVDDRAALEAFLEEVGPAIPEGLATMEAVEVKFHRVGRDGGTPPDGGGAA
jgi:uncharacterized protein